MDKINLLYTDNNLYEKFVSNNDKIPTNKKELQNWYDKIYHDRKQNPKKFPQTSPHWKRNLICISKLNLKFDDRILICGGGHGDNLTLLEQFFPQCKNLIINDFSKIAVDFINKWFPNVETEVSCITETKLDNESIDKILALDFTEHLTNEIYKKFLHKAWDLLKSNGQLAILPGQTLRIEHINLLSINKIINDLKEANFSIHNHNKKWIIARKK